MTMNPFGGDDDVNSSANPFEDDNLCDVDLYDNAESHLNLTKESRQTTSSNGSKIEGSRAAGQNENKKSKITAKTMDEVAAHILDAHLYLTALELHTELTERGRELPRLRDYFSNPANFEQSAISKPTAAVLSTTVRPSFNSYGDYLGDRTTNLSRTGSASTFDSLEWSHLSEENEPTNDRIAVLEFQLRKANETITKLRRSLTSSSRNHPSLSETGINAENHAQENRADTLTSYAYNKSELNETLSPKDNENEFYLTDDSGFQADNLSQSGFSSLDSKTLNFVVYEYLQSTGCKLTSLTLADELPDQDFEDWDDVGLNTSRPPSLKDIYLKYLEGCRYKKQATRSEDIQCNLENSNLEDKVLGEEDKGISDVSVVNSSGGTSLVVENKNNNEPGHSAGANSQSMQLAANQNGEEEELKVEVERLNEQVERSNQKLEELQSEVSSLKNELLLVQGQNKQLVHKNLGLESEVADLEASLQRVYLWQREREKPLECSAEPCDDTNSVLTEKGNEEQEGATERTDAAPSSLFSKRYLLMVKNGIFNTPPAVASLDQEHQSILDCVQKGGDLADVAHKCLPNMVANVLLQHRIEAIPLIIETISVHPEQNARLRLLELLFNLVKKPDIRQRFVICQSCVTYARRAGPARVESEVLPLCWGQMNEKHVERRILVAETATALLPYMDLDIASSLVYSILTQLLEDKEDTVVAAALKGLAYLQCMLSSVDDKFDSYLKLILKFIKSAFETEQVAVRHFLIPCFAYWAMQKQDEDLLQQAVFILVQHMDNLLKETAAASEQPPVDELSEDVRHNQTTPEFQASFMSFCASLESFIPFLFVNVIQTSPFACKPPPSKDALLSQSEELNTFFRFPEAVISAQDVRSMVSDSAHLAYLIHTFDEYLKESTHPEWPQLVWVIEELLPRLVQILLQLNVNAVPCVNGMSTVCYTLCRVFGTPFTLNKCTPLFKAKLTFDIHAQDFNNAQFVAVLNGSLVPVFAAGVLSTISDDKGDMKDIGDFVSEMLFLYSVNRAPLLSLRAAMIALLSNPTYHPVLTESIYSAIINASSQLKLTACHMIELLINRVNQDILAQRVIPALITLASDADVQVRAATISCLGSVLVKSSSREIHDKVSMQLDSLMDDEHLQVEAVKVFARVVHSVEERLRIEFVFERVSSIADQLESIAEVDQGLKGKLCAVLFQFYSTVCPQCAEYPKDVILSSVLPAVRKVKNHYSVVTGAPNEHFELMSSFIRDMEVHVGIIPMNLPGNSKFSSSVSGKEGNLFSKLKGLTK